MYLEEDYCLKAKPASELHLIDLLDTEMEGIEKEPIDRKPDCSLEQFVNKKNVSDVNNNMLMHTPESILKKAVLHKLKSEFDLFLWKKRYAQSLGVNMLNSLLFLKEHNFERLRILVTSAEYFDDNINFKIDLNQKSKKPL